MKSSVILKRQYAKDDSGTLFIRYFNGRGEHKDKSLKVKMSLIYFKKYDKDFQRFRKNTLFDYISINDKIANHINDFSIFDTVKKTDNLEIITNLKNKTKLINNPATLHSYSNVISILEKFLNNKETIKEFKDLSSDLLVELKNELVAKGLKESTILQYFVVLKSLLNKVRKDIEFKNPLILKEFGLKPIKQRKNILSKLDIIKLLNTNKDNKYFTEVQISLFQLFCNGARISDVFLMKIGDLQKDGILYITKKNNVELFVNYNPPLVDVLFKYLDLKLPFKVSWEDNDWIYSADLDVKFGKIETKLEILKDYLKTANKDKLIFNDYIEKKGKALLKYNKVSEMTKEQMRVFNNILAYHLQKLKFIIKDRSLEIPNLTTHTMRYTFTNLLLTMDGVNLLDISKALGHANIRVTNDYLEGSFGSEREKQLSLKLGKII
jgi:integrase